MPWSADTSDVEIRELYNIAFQKRSGGIQLNKFGTVPEMHCGIKTSPF